MELSQRAFSSCFMLTLCGDHASLDRRRFLRAYEVFFHAIVYHSVVAFSVCTGMPLGMGGGWLANLGLLDYAVGVVVHITGGTAAPVAAIVLGPRTGLQHRVVDPS